MPFDLLDKRRDEDGPMFDGPEYSDCETAAHLRDCGFCRAAVNADKVERMYAAINNMMSSEFMHGSEPAAIWFGITKQPEPPSTPQRTLVRRVADWWYGC